LTFGRYTYLDVNITNISKRHRDRNDSPQCHAVIVSLGGNATLELVEPNVTIECAPGTVVLLDAQGTTHNVLEPTEGRQSLVLSTHNKWFFPQNEGEVELFAATGGRHHKKAKHSGTA
jgi:hypothetical protein